MEWYPPERGPGRQMRALARSRRALAGLILLVLIVGLPLAVVARDGGAPVDGRAPRAGTVEATAPPAPTLAGAAPPATPVPAPAEDIDRITRQVVDIRGLPAREPIDAGLVEPEALVATLRARTVPDSGDLEAQQRLLATIRLIPATTDLAEVFDQLYEDTVVGLYVPQERRLHLASSLQRLTPAVQWTAAHEIVHALQDQSFDLAGLFASTEGRSDAALALTALVEGDAVVTQEAWSRRFQTAVERDLIGEELGPAGVELSRAPAYFRERFRFPYREGARFVVALYEQGGFAAVDAAFADPPQSTAEILDPGRYRAGGAPVPVGLAGSPGDGWEQVLAGEFGAFDLRQLLAVFGPRRAASLAAGWSGGHVRSWHRGEDTAVAIDLRFDTAAYATAVCAVLPNWWTLAAGGEPPDADGLLESPHGWAGAACDAEGVRIAVAPDRETAARLRRDR